jgi:CDP-diacylglycerol--inositol 3-phosphatidyltransferase
MYSTSSLRQHHKSKDGNTGRNFLVRWFYEYYYFFGYLCVGAEFTYILSYATQYTPGTWYHEFLRYLLWGFLPGCVMKQAVNVMQLTSACYAVAKHDADGKIKK